MSEELGSDLRDLRARLARDMRDRWHRDLPLAELLNDRWERARSLGFGEGSSIYDVSYVYGDVAVGVHTWIGPFTLLDGTGGLTIGDYCSISAGVHIYTHDTVAWALSGGQLPTDRSAVVIGDNTYVGSQTVIGRGVTIGDHCVIGAGSFVNRSIPPYSVAVGSPCRVIGAVRISDTGEIRLEYSRRRRGPQRE